MGSIQLYTEPQQQGLKTYQAGTFTTTDLEKGVDYTEGYLKKIEVQSINKQCWFAKLTLSTGGFENLDMSQATSLLPQINMEAVDMGGGTYHYKPTNCDLTATALATRPLDWDIRWRDKYTAEPILYTTTVTPAKSFYANQPLSAPTSGGTPGERAFVANTYYETNQGRWLFWTLSECYFAIEGQWAVNTNVGTSCANQIIAFNAGMGSTNASVRAAARYVNCIRERGYQGPMINLGTEAEFNNFCSYSSIGVTPDNQETRVFAGFVQFSYPITLESEEVINEDMMGICVYRISADGYILSAQISAISEDFWKGKTRPPYDGPTSNVQGGGGNFARNSQSNGDRTGANAANITTRWNNARASLLSGYNRYVMDFGSMAAFNEFLTQLTNPSWMEGWQNLVFSPLDNILVCHSMPGEFAPPQSGNLTSKIIVAGHELTTNAAPVWANPYVSKHIGDFDLTEFYGAYLDYIGTSVYVNLPYIGVVQLDTSAGMAGWVSIDYMADALSGDIIALVTTCDRNGNSWKRYSYKGNCAAAIPLATYTPLSTRFSAGGISVLTGLLGNTVASGLQGRTMGSTLADIYSRDWEYDLDDSDISGAVQTGWRGGAISGIIGSVGGAIQGLQSVATAGSGTTMCNASDGGMTAPIDTDCWILVVRPEWSNPDYYPREAAYTSDIAGKVGDFEGTLSVSSVELENIKCTDDERVEIFNNLIAGVYLTDRQK